MGPAASVGAVAGTRLVGQQAVARGVANQHWLIPGSDMWVAQIDPNVASLKLVEGHDAIGGRETVASICQRTPNCVDAINADFYDPADGQPLGGVVINGDMWRSPIPAHEQVSLSPLGIDEVNMGGWSGLVTDPAGTRIALTAVNYPGGGTQVVLYTNRFKGRTPACTCTEIIGDRRPSEAAPIGHPLTYRFSGVGHGGTPLGPGRVVIAGFGSSATKLASWRRTLGPSSVFTVAVSTTRATTQDVGGHPWLIHNGQAWPYDAAQAQRDPVLRAPYPRTVLAWTGPADHPTTEWMVAIDGADKQRGMTIQQTIDFLLNQLHATEAIGLDSGDSTTFVVDGRVANHPSVNPPRAVVNAILVTAVALPARPALAPRPRTAVPVAAHSGTAHTVVAAPPRRPAPTKAALKPVRARPAPTTTTVAPTTTTVAPTATVTLAPLVRPPPVAAAAQPVAVAPATPARPMAPYWVWVLSGLGALTVAGLSWWIRRRHRAHQINRIS
jgi:hypothetical protein